MTTFDKLGLSPSMLRAVEKLGYVEATPVQEQAIPLALAGEDVIAAAKTGTGKTAAFSLPCLDRLGHAGKGCGPLMLVVTPTRELAMQIGEVCNAIAEITDHRILTVVGGVSYEPQKKALKEGVDVLVATPGRLIDLMNQGAAHLGEVEMLVLDEADRMLDMGFWPDIKRFLKAIPEQRQTLLFSATIDKNISKTIAPFLKDPKLVEIARRGETADTIDQYLIHVAQTAKPKLLEALLRERGSERVIVFTRTRSRADSTCRRLRRAGFSAEPIHSDRKQNQRKRALCNFAEHRTDVIVATDVLARGIDVAEVSYVVNYDLPKQAEDYVHRIGRTGRAGMRGYAVSFVNPEMKAELKAIEKLIKRSIPETTVEGFDEEEAVAEAKAKQDRYEAKRDEEVQSVKKALAAKKRRQNRAAKRLAEAEEQKRLETKGSSKRRNARRPEKARMVSAQEANRIERRQAASDQQWYANFVKSGKSLEEFEDYAETREREARMAKDENRKKGNGAHSEHKRGAGDKHSKKNRSNAPRKAGAYGNRGASIDPGKKKSKKEGDKPFKGKYNSKSKKKGFREDGKPAKGGVAGMKNLQKTNGTAAVLAQSGKMKMGKKLSSRPGKQADRNGGSFGKRSHNR